MHKVSRGAFAKGVFTRAVLGLLLVVPGIAAPALAQGVLPAFPEPAVKIDTAKPFGDLDVSPARSLPAKQIAEWVAKLSPAQKQDLETRCNLMYSRDGEFKPVDITFCQQWQFGRSFF